MLAPMHMGIVPFEAQSLLTGTMQPKHCIQFTYDRVITKNKLKSTTIWPARRWRIKLPRLLEIFCSSKSSYGNPLYKRKHVQVCAGETLETTTHTTLWISSKQVANSKCSGRSPSHPPWRHPDVVKLLIFTIPCIPWHCPAPNHAWSSVANQMTHLLQM